jgi:diguanylate cyclase (GGDEF)-like protein/PAS domain S-box-containing protein
MSSRVGRRAAFFRIRPGSRDGVPTDPAGHSEDMNRPQPATTPGALPSLATSQPILTVLLNSLDGMVYRLRVDPDWVVEHVTDGCEALLGLPAAQLVGHGRIAYDRLIHPDDRQRVRAEIYRVLIESQPFEVEYRISLPDATAKWVLERGVAFRDRHGRRMIEGFVEDVTDRHRAVEALANAERRFRSIFENTLEGIFQTTVEGRYISANPALARIYGYESPEELVSSLAASGRQLYVDATRRADFERLMREVGSVTQFESQVCRRDGSVIWISENARAVRAPDGRALYYEGTVEDITERKRYQAELEFQATHDSLTGLPNRGLLEDRLRQAIGYAHRNGSLVAVAFIDLDRFKVINDSLGHVRGDELLMRVSRRIRGALREIDTVARQGGDEFVVVLAEQSTVESVVAVVERIIDEVAQPVTIDGRELYVTCSIGIALYPSDGGDATTLLRNADAAMYSAKERGRNSFQFYAPNMNALALERLALEGSLRRATEREEFEVHYQPRIDIRSKRIVGMEALVRWRDAELGFVPPAKFIPVAEEANLISQIGEQVLRAACRQARYWVDLGFDDLSVSVNLSARQFRQGHLVSTIAAALAETGLEAARLELELTESTIMGHGQEFVAMLAELKKLGVRVAIDDFGTGYSNLSYLSRFPIDSLKIDRSFVSEVATDQQHALLAKAVISLGHSLRLKVVAEGVETAEQLAFLRHHGCDEVQGYYFSKPVPPDEFERMLARWPSGAAAN